MTTSLVESRPVVLTEAVDSDTGLFELQLISPGMGSCGLYPEETLTEAVKAGVWGKGCHLYLDHPTASEAVERPERSVRDLAGVLQEDAHWNGSAVVAKAKVYSAFRPLLAEAAADIGMSIRAAGTAELGEHNGKQVQVITTIDEVFSVDFVTKAGRGGAVLSVLEAARMQATEASTETTRELLTAAVQDGHGGKGTYVWVRDFDPDKNLVWFNVTTDDESGSTTYEQSYSYDGSVLDLTGEASEVRQVTNYVPVNTPAGRNPIESQGGTMPQIEEAEHRRLVEAAGRVSVLESERDAAIQRATAAEERATRTEGRLAEADARTAARPIIAEVFAGHQLPAATHTRVVEGVVGSAPLTDAGTLDEAALRTAAETARTQAEAEIAEALTAAGAGRITGFGQSAGTEVSEADIEKATAGAFGRTLKEA